MNDKSVKGKDAFWDLICYYLANGVLYMPQPPEIPVHFRTINQDKCPEGYRGIKIFIKETELKKYENI